MQFLLFDVSATLVFLLAYLVFVGLQRRRAPAIMAATGSQPRGVQPAVPPREGRKPAPTHQERPAIQCCREWPRLSAPR